MNKYFPYLIALSAFLIAGSAAWFSVFGLSKLFAGASVAVIIMAGSLEFGKLIAASFLYRYWNTLHGLMKTYLTIGVIVLVLVTSAGIFGFLSNAYQVATVGFEKEMNELSFNEDKLLQLQEDQLFLKSELEIQSTSLPDNYITAKRKLREDYNPRIRNLSVSILDTKIKISELKSKLVDTGVDVGPAIYLARAFDTDVDAVVKFFIFVLIFVFDPMAIILVIAANMVLIEKYETHKTTGERMFDKYKESKKGIEDNTPLLKEELDLPPTIINKIKKKAVEVIGRGGITP